MSNPKLKCEENAYLYSKLESLRRSLQKSNNDSKAQNARRILQALERFPLPILSGDLAFTLLQGVGPWWANEISTYLASKPQKRKASPVPVQKRQISFTPTCGSKEWTCLMCLKHSPDPIASYDIRYLTLKYLSGYSIESVDDYNPVLESLAKLNLTSEDAGRFTLTEIGVEVVERMKDECLRVIEKKPHFDPDSWIEVGMGATESDESFDTECGLDFEIVLLVDTAERLAMDFGTIFTRLACRKVLVERKKLWIGDYQWVCRVKERGKITDFSVGIVVERKTADDLVHSIVDFRYEEQKIRMKLSNAVCIYLLEGKTPKGSSKISSSTLINSLLSTKFNYNFQIKLTPDSKQSLNWLARLTAAIYEEISSWSNEKILGLSSYEDFFYKTNPNSGLTVKEVFGKQLRALDKIGEHNTLAVLKKFPTPLALYLEINQAQQGGKRALNKFFKSIRLENGNIITKTTRAALVNLFLG